MNVRTILTPTLLLTGFAIMALGVNVGLGGIQTLGWQMPGPFIEITDPQAFHVHDSHVRFIGGVWFGVGAVFALGSVFRAQLRPTLIVLCAVIACAGLFRLSGMAGGAVFGAAIAPSLALELAAFPLLGWWVFNAGAAARPADQAA